MAKRIKAGHASKRLRPAPRIEVLEARQLLAAVTGSGTEVGTNIVHPNGNVYDQVLMTGSSVSVGADANQVTRVSFVDLSGDIVQAEFSGAGTLQITLENFGAAAPAANYNQPGVNYVSGRALFSIQGAGANTNFSVFSIGSANAVNQSLFTGGKSGGNHYADVASLRIANDAQSGTTSFAGIRAGNAIFSSNVGLAGISATGVSVSGPVIIGDVDALSGAFPSLGFGSGSTFGTLTVTGGDLQQSAVFSPFPISGFSQLHSVPGTTSAGVAINSQSINASAQAAMPSVSITVFDSTTAVDLTGKTQAQLDTIFNHRTFTNLVTVSGDLAAGLTLSGTEFRGGIVFKGEVLGTVASARGISSIIAEKSLHQVLVGSSAQPSAAIGDITVGGSLTGPILAASIGNVGITGNISGTGGLSTDVDLVGSVPAGNNAYTLGEGKIGNVSVGGSIQGTGFIEGVLGIGNISVGGDVTSNNSLQGGVFVTRSGTTTDAALANIGTLTVNGDVDQGGTTSNLVHIANGGAWGAITVKGAGTSTGTTQVGVIRQGGTALGGTTGAISLTETASDLSWGGMTVSASSGAVGKTTVIGAGTTTADFTLDGEVTVAGVAAGAIAVSGFLTIDLNAGFNASTAPISLTTVTGSTTTPALVTIDAAWGSLTTDLGDITINAGAANSTIDFNQDFVADDFGAVTLTAANIDMSAGFGLRNDETAGAITLNGASTLTGKAIELEKNVASISLNGPSTFSGGIVIGTGSIAAAAGVAPSTGNVTGALTLTNAVFAAGASVKISGSVGSLVLQGTTDFSATTATAILLDNGGAGLDVLSSVAINGTVKGSSTAGVNDITASAMGNFSIVGSPTTASTLVASLSVLAAPNGNTTASLAETVAMNGSNLANYAMGDITIKTELALPYMGTTLFSGDNSFAALGRMGNISIVGSPGAQQSALFAAAGDAAWFAVGDVDGLLNTTAALGTNVGRDVDGNVTAVNYTAGSVAIGNVFLNAHGTNGVNGIGGAAANAGSTIEGFAVLSGIRVKAADGDLINPTDDNVAANILTNLNAQKIDADLGGTIGNITVTNHSQAGFRASAVLGTTLLGANDTDSFSAIIAATSVGTQQQVAGSGSSTSGFVAIIGDDNGTADTVIEDNSQIVIIVI